MAWWRRERTPRMLRKPFTLRDTEEWDSTANTNNRVESLNRQAVENGSVQALQKLLKVLLNSTKPTRQPS